MINLWLHRNGLIDLFIAWYLKILDLETQYGDALLSITSENLFGSTVRQSLNSLHITRHVWFF